VAGAYLTSLMLFRKPLSDETLHQLSLKDSRQLSDLTEDRGQAADPPTRFGVLSRWLRGSQTSTQLHTAGGDQRQRSPSAGMDIKASVDEAYNVRARSTCSEIWKPTRIKSRHSSGLLSQWLRSTLKNRAVAIHCFMSASL